VPRGRERRRLSNDFQVAIAMMTVTLLDGRASPTRARREPPRPRDFLRPQTLPRRRGDDPRLPEEPGHRVRRLRAHAEPVPAGFSAGGFSRSVARASRAKKTTETRGMNAGRSFSRAEEGGREGTHLARSIFKPMCLFPSISVGGGGRRGGGGQSGATRGGGRGRDGRAANVSAKRAVTHPAWDRSAR